MPAYSFKQQFVEPIIKGHKKQTIRGRRKHQAKPGDVLYLYYAMRTKWCTKIGEAICKNVDDILINNTGEVFVNGIRYPLSEKHLLALKDGFWNWNEMFQFFKANNKLPFRGDIIYWENFKRAKQKTK